MNKNDGFDIIGHFKGRSIITLDDIRQHFITEEPNLNDSTLRWRIHRLKERRILLQVKRGVYTLNPKPLFKPKISRQIYKIHSILADSYSPSLSHVIWTTEWLHQFMVQQPSSSIIIVETEKDWLNSVFTGLQPDFKNVYLNPDAKVVSDYLLIQKESVVVKPLISRSPTYEIREHLKVATLEKILVDVFCDSHLFVSYQGSELENIFGNAWKSYSLNLSSLINYAKRRKREEALKSFLKKSRNQELHRLISQ